MTDYISSLVLILENHANAETAVQQSAYMKQKFAFFGLKAQQRRALYKPFFDKSVLPFKDEAIEIAQKLNLFPQRELHYFAMEMMYELKGNYEKEDITWIEYLITHNSWWDTVDFIADKIAGTYFHLFPCEILPVTGRWMDSKNLWLQRSALLFQLNYKEKTNTELLSEYTLRLADNKEFFIRKAIGWILRGYAKTNPEWVKTFVQKHNDQLSGLSKREALKHIN